jgi:leucyl aminopeptidase
MRILFKEIDMNTVIDFNVESFDTASLKIVGAYEKTKDKEKTAVLSWSDKQLVKAFSFIKDNGGFTGSAGSSFTFTAPDCSTVMVVGLGEKSKVKSEGLRVAIAKTLKALSSKNFKSVAIDAASFNCLGKIANTTVVIKEALELAAYDFNKYKANKKDNSKKEVLIFVNDKKAKRTIEKLSAITENITSSMNFSRALLDEAPNVLHSEEYSKRIQADVKKNLKGVKVKVLGKAELKKEKMGMFLAVNAGSAYAPQLVHLTYTPKKVTKNTKHIALVGKGLTFDTGGYSLKPGGSMVTMKYDMGGSATVYGAFRAAVLNNSNYKITCVLGMTDNAVNENATFPDAIVTARNGKTVEILNTDAEGRLVLGDCLSYVSDMKPDMIFNAATLTGACLVALGREVCAVLGSDKATKKVLDHAKSSDEQAWRLPIVDQWRDEMKSNIADLQNIGKSRFAGTATAAAFLENFVTEGIEWAHLDIAGVASDQAHLPYCPPKGGSGIMIRTLHDILVNG